MQISATLRITGDCLIPSDITGILGVEPRSSRLKGEVSVSGTNKNIVSRFGSWTWRTPAREGLETLNDHIQLLDKTFAGAHVRMPDLPHVEHAWLDVCITREEADGGDTYIDFTLDSASVAVLHKLGLLIEVSIY